MFFLQQLCLFSGSFAKKYIFLGVLYHRPWCLTVLTRVGVGLAGQSIAFFLCKHGSFAKLLSFFVGVVFDCTNKGGSGRGSGRQDNFYLQKWEFCKTFMFLWEFYITGSGV